MDVEDDTRDGSVSSVILESLESIWEGDKLSDEDLAWVNSCLVTDNEIVESNWTSFKDVLLEIIGDQSESLDSSATGSNGFSGATEIRIVPSIEEADATNYSGRTDDYPVVVPINGDTETNTNNIPIKKRTGILSQFFQEDPTETFQGNPFLPTYNEDERKDEAVDLGLQLSLSADEMNSSTVDIFKVWDLDIPAEEGDLIKQLNKAVAETETAFQSTPLAFDDSTAWKDLKDEPLDNLIAGIADLSLNTKSFS
ncbi:uncharacterized protein LOC111308814 [Durio zibethinus]|uniref:Uncharacterized protein LOC111308814 n=1 Tax=Durio zibethinus TaxID=66656 RepID=A0A6P6AE70_DURZI|nr:uncharacterized protein LOC111308814 [Durio zibethinus]XP_022763163.1 uncharacterized protein LOC111308814 [Durio zibethinus]XP_022763164.1 uncharacterized protein LOC111308814 [Durio zibethinus]XP_022763165.1 uncharacterized protein LOC111308814 [Durio zibethinus]